jgi:hypothetical protein
LYLDDHEYRFLLKNLIFNGTSEALHGKTVCVDMDNYTSVAGYQFAGLYLKKTSFLFYLKMNISLQMTLSKGEGG